MIKQADIQQIIYISISYLYLTIQPKAIASLNTSDKSIILEAISMVANALAVQIDTEEIMKWFIDNLSTYNNKVKEIMSDETLTEYEAFQQIYNALHTQEEKSCST